MFINAEPRFVSNGFETFVPVQRADLLHQRLVEMTNNDVNAWSIFRPVAASTSDNWDYNFEEYNNNENFQVGSLAHGKLPATDEFDRSTACTEAMSTTALLHRTK